MAWVPLVVEVATWTNLNTRNIRFKFDHIPCSRILFSGRWAYLLHHSTSFVCTTPLPQLMFLTITRELVGPDLSAGVKVVRFHRRQALFATPRGFSKHHHILAFSTRSYAADARVGLPHNLPSSAARPSSKAPILGPGLLVPDCHSDRGDESGISRESERQIQNHLRGSSPTMLHPMLKGYRKAQANGFLGTFFEYRLHARISIRKNPEETPWITTLRLQEGLSRNQYIYFGLNKTNKWHEDNTAWKGYVLYGGEILGRIALRTGRTSKTFPLNETVCPYVIPGSYVLRLRKRDGSDHEYQVDLRDWMYKPWCRSLADLAAKQGLIEPITSDGYIKTFDFKENLRTQYRVVFTRVPSERNLVFGMLRLEPQLNARDTRFRLDPSEVSDLPDRRIRVFFYIDPDGAMKLWDVDRERDVMWRVPNAERQGFSTAWSGEEVRGWPDLFAHAQRLGYWRNVS